MDKISIGILGGGTVGSGVVRVLQSNQDAIRAQLGADIDVRAVAVKDLNKTRDSALDPALLTDDPQSVIEDPEISIVVELVGGVDQAFDYILSAIKNKKHVVTANKALLASRGTEIFSAASENGVDVFYEGAVCGGIPIIRALRESLSSERIHSVRGIVNGTTNFILSAMSSTGAAYEETLAEAMRLGYAEADPTADVGGHDAAQKLSILATLAFRTPVHERDVYVEGIEKIESVDMSTAAKYGYTIKPLAIAARENEKISVRVHPAWVPNDSMLAHVNGVFNAVLLESEALGTSMFYGQGAGQLPTGSAVLADIIDLARKIRSGATGQSPQPAAQSPQVHASQISKIGETESAYYLRFSVADTPGVLGRIATSLGESGVSLRIVDQEIPPHSDYDYVPIIALTHRASEAALQEALLVIDAMDTTRAPTRFMRIV
jgi:homoserine dehydrogenase